MSVLGTATFDMKSGKKAGPYNATFTKDDNCLDVSKGGKDYPTKLDFNKFKTVGSITFKPNLGGSSVWTTWNYFSNGQWLVDRFTELG